MNTKQCEVIILPIDAKPILDQIYKWNTIPPEGDGVIGTFNEYGANNPSSMAIPQHLYIVSNEEMKVDDWLYNEVQKSIVLVDCQANADLANVTKYRRKIIASTDLQLVFNQKIFPVTVPIFPEIPQSFISLYIEEYNAGRKIEKVDVEYEQYGDVPYYYIYGNCKYECKYKGDWFDLTNGEVEMSKSEENLDTIATKHYYSAFTNPDSTINIKSLKDSWTREEVEDLCKNAFDSGMGCIISQLPSINSNVDVLKGFTKWIKENL